ncbi:AraC family transcriptional regulator [Kosakonia sp. MUSA4]|uniref:AraC family transcriptional regulator n=1 Tax=Kosakonia sp. MUSA4 TaxID=2067958 RepID=UPI0015991788|nr:AraC family transcriptional regulator [Kosakonia sp. MUSA4]QJT79287.1 AraC family transcriptional regulator [Kosakonia sp. MUSA4]
MYQVNQNFIKMMSHALENMGLDIGLLFIRADIDKAIIEAGNRYIPSTIVHKLFHAAADMSGDECIGLMFHDYFHPSYFDLLSYTMMSSNNLLHALENFCRFSALVYNGGNVTLTKSGQYTYCLTFSQCDELDSIKSFLRYFYDAGVACVYAYCKWLGISDSLRLYSISFCYEKPADIRKYENMFSCPIQFGMAVNSITFYEDDLLKPLMTKNEILQQFHEGQSQLHLEIQSRENFKSKVKVIVKEQIKKGHCTIISVAAALFMTQRTLQRRLEKESIYFKDILSDVKKEMAIYYLLHTQYSLSYISILLGYQDISSFSRVCIRWFGIAPSVYRSLNNEA